MSDTDRTFKQIERLKTVGEVKNFIGSMNMDLELLETTVETLARVNKEQALEIKELKRGL